jgi:hypothetical protein
MMGVKLLGELVNDETWRGVDVVWAGGMRRVPL